MLDINAKILQILEEAKNEIVSNIESKGIKASGRTQKSIKVVQRDGHISLIKEEGENAPIETLEIGRPAGKIPYKFNEIILLWMKDKGISGYLVPYKTDRPHKYSAQERSDRLAAGAIAYKKIRELGTERHLNPRIDVYTPPVEKAVERIKATISEVVINSIKDKK